MIVHCRVIWHNAYVCTLFNIDPAQPDELRIIHSNLIAYMSPYAIYEFDESDLDTDSGDRLRVKKVPFEWSDKLDIDIIRRIWVAWYGNIPDYKLGLESKSFIRPNDIALHVKCSPKLTKFHNFLHRDYMFKDCDDWLACFQHWDWAVCNYVATHHVGTHKQTYQLYSNNPWYPEPFNLPDNDRYATHTNVSGGRTQVITLYKQKFYIRERDARLERAIFNASQTGKLYVRHEPVRSTPFTNVVSVADINKKRRRTPFSIIIDDVALDLANFVSLMRPYEWCGYMAIDINCDSKKVTHYLLIDDHMTDETPCRITEAAIANLGFSRDRAPKCPQHLYIRSAHAATHAELAHFTFNIDVQNTNLTWHIHGDGSFYAFHNTRGLLFRSLRDLALSWQPCARKPISRGSNDPLSSSRFTIVLNDNFDYDEFECKEPKENTLYLVETKYDKVFGICINTSCFKTMHGMTYNPLKVYKISSKIFVGDIWAFSPNTFPFAEMETSPSDCPYMVCRAAALCGKPYTPSGPSAISTPLAPLRTPTLLMTLLEDH